MGGEFSVKRVLSEAIDKYDTYKNEKKYEKQQLSIPPTRFYNQLLGAQLGRTSDTAATRDAS